MDLEIRDADADAWFGGQLGHDERQLPRLHLIVGDSVARDAPYRASAWEDSVLNLSKNSATWRMLSKRIHGDLKSWSTVAAASGKARGTLIMWLSGNDAYSQLSGLANKDRAHLRKVQDEVREVLGKIREAGYTEEVVVLGPIPRPAADLMEGTWESTGAYHLERALLKMRLGDGVTLVKLGRALTIKISKKRSGIGYKCLPWYKQDQVHLSAGGYRKLAPKLPAILKM